MAAILEGMLAKRGFKMLSTAKVADVLGADGAKPSAQWLNAKDKILKMAREAGADLVIAGRLELQLKEKITAEKAGGMTSLIGQIPAEVKLTVRGMNAVEGTLFSTKPWTKRETGLNVARIMYRTLHGKSILRDANGKKVKDKKVKCILEDNKDIYKRNIGTCYIKKQDINGWLVKNGHAIAYKRYSKKYVLYEQYAKENKLGIWRGTFIEPEKWRRIMN